MVEIAPAQIYTIRDVAEYFKCSTRKVHRLVASGQLRGFKIGNQRRFKGEEILQYIERQNDGIVSPLIVPTVQADRLYSLREVSAILQIPMSEAVHMLREGRLPGFRVGIDWRCWGRDLMKLAQALHIELSSSAAGESEAAKPSALSDASESTAVSALDQDMPSESA